MRPWVAVLSMSAMSLALNRLPPLSATSFRVAILGDAHGDFHPDELRTLEAVAAPALFLAVGDFGNEDHAIVESVVRGCREHLRGAAHLVLGNHECWRSGSGKRGGGGGAGASLRKIQAAVAGLDVAYRRVEVPTATGVVSLVGARPLSWGGGLDATSRLTWSLLEEMYGVSSAEESTALVTDALLGAVGPAILLAHQGPTGLGADRAAACGRDWTKEPADFGDDDLRAVLDTAAGAGVAVPLCVFGHMHSGLRHGGRRRMAVEDGGTLFLNAAEVPRHRPSASSSYDAHYTIVDFEGGAVASATGVWLNGDTGLAEAAQLWPLPGAPPEL